jgi:parallel beta-helix repeat protein
MVSLVPVAGCLPVHARVGKSARGSALGTPAVAPSGTRQFGGPSVNVMDFGARGDGVGDDGAAFRAAYDALSASGGVIYVPAPRVRYRVSGRGATIGSPKIAIPVTKPNVWVIGVGEPVILMDAFSRAEAEALRESAGVDVFTIIAFVDTHGGGVTGIRFEGLADGEGLVLGRARAKGIGVTNSSNIRISHVSGYRIVGNVVNARGTLGPAATSDVSVTDSYAEGCSESGFNFMGGTSRMVFANNVSLNNGYHGLETGSSYLTVTGNVFARNKDGMTHVGRYAAITGNVFAQNRIAGFNYQWNRDGDFDGAYNTLSNNTLADNGVAGVVASAKTHDNVINGNLISNNGSGKSPGTGIVIASGCHDFDIANNLVLGGPTSRIGIRLVDSSRMTLRGNTLRGHSRQSILAEGAGQSHVYDGNVVEHSPAISAETTDVSVRDFARHGITK